MNTNELLSATGESVEYGRQYIEQQMEIVRLETAKRIAMTTSGLVTSAVLAILALLVIIFLSIALGFLLGNILGSYALAFFIISAFYLIATLLILKFKRQLITNPILSMVLNNILN